MLSTSIIVAVVASAVVGVAVAVKRVVAFDVVPGTWLLVSLLFLAADGVLSYVCCCVVVVSCCSLLLLLLLLLLFLLFLLLLLLLLCVWLWLLLLLLLL